MQTELILEHKKPTQADKILKLLQEKGSISNVELNRVAYRYSARILELKKRGYDIQTGPTNKFGLVIYTYKGRK